MLAVPAPMAGIVSLLPTFGGAVALLQLGVFGFRSDEDGNIGGLVREGWEAMKGKPCRGPK
jgi:hypothetical protein